MPSLSVSELTNFIKKNLEKDFSCLSVEGEVSNFTDTSGHLYFTLKDPGSQSKGLGATISCALFRNARKNMQDIPKNGDLVLVQGDLSVYPPRGSYQIIVRSLRYAGVGAFLARFHEIKNKLQKAGLFSQEKKKKLPYLPKKIGVITSPTGAVIHDILHVLRRRFPGFQMVLYPVKVQGDAAAKEISLAVEEMNRFQLCDLIILGRGGGSLEDLWAFNEEILAKAIFASTIPIISAVGHDTDYSISDWVSDKRAPTPSAAAEIALPEKALLQEALRKAKEKLAFYLRQKILERKKNLSLLASMPHFSDPYYFLAKWQQILDEKKSSLKRLISLFLERKQASLDRLKDRYDEKNPLDKIQKKRESLLQYQKHIDALHPKNLMKKGYGILFSEKTGAVILSTSAVEIGEEVICQLGDGTLKSRVSNIQEGSLL